MQDKLARKISNELNLDQDQYEVISYGAFAFIQVILSIAAVAFLGLIFDVMFQALIVSFSTSILRQYSGGVHAGKPGTCLVIGTTVSVGIAVFIRFIINYLILFHILGILIGAFLISIYIIYKNAPVDSEAKPIKTEIKQKRMKKKSFIVLLIYFILTITLLLVYLNTLDINFIIYLLDICGGMLFQIFSLTIIGHKILSKIDNIVTRVLYRR